MPNKLAGFLNTGPFWFAGNLPFPGSLSYHAVVVGAIWADGNADRTMLLIYDPWPVKTGEVYGIILADYVRADLTGTPRKHRDPARWNDWLSVSEESSAWPIRYVGLR